MLRRTGITHPTSCCMESCPARPRRARQGRAIFAHKRDDRAGERHRLIPVRRMSAFRQLEQPCVRNPLRDGVELRHRPVFVVLPLHRQHRTANSRTVGPQYSRRERRGRARHRSTRKTPNPGRRGSARDDFAGRSCSRQYVPLRYWQCSHPRRKRGMRPPPARRRDQETPRRRAAQWSRRRYARRATGVRPSPRSRKQRRQNRPGLRMHEFNRPLLRSGPWRRASVSIAGKQQPACPRSRAQRLRKILPHRQRTQSVVQKYDQRRIATLVADPRVLETLRACRRC